MKKWPDLSLDDFLTISGCSPLEPRQANDDMFVLEVTGKAPASPMAVLEESVPMKADARCEDSKNRRRANPAA